MIKQYGLLGFIAVVGVLAIGFVLNDRQPVFAGVQVGSEYFSTSTVPMTTGAVLAATRQWQVKTNYDSSSNSQIGSTILGSVVIASSSPTTALPVKIWNATSTTDVSSTTLVYIPSASANGTYTYDVVLTRGLIVELPTGFNGSFNITSR